MTNENEYAVSDIQIASLLYAKGIEYLRVEDLDGKRKNFIFKNEEKIAAIVKGFWDDSIEIAPRKYMSAFRVLKNELYN